MTEELKNAQTEDRNAFREFILGQMPAELFANLPATLGRAEAEELAELAAAQTLHWPDSGDVFWLIVADYFADAEPGEVAEYELEDALIALQEGETPAEDEKSAMAWLYIIDNYPDVSFYSTLGQSLAALQDETHEDQAREVAEHAIECVAVGRYPELLGEIPLFLRPPEH